MGKVVANLRLSSEKYFFTQKKSADVFVFKLDIMLSWDKRTITIWLNSMVQLFHRFHPSIAETHPTPLCIIV